MAQFPWKCLLQISTVLSSLCIEPTNCPHSYQLNWITNINIILPVLGQTSLRFMEHEKENTKKRILNMDFLNEIFYLMPELVEFFTTLRHIDWLWMSEQYTKFHFERSFAIQRVRYSTNLLSYIICNKPVFTLYLCT